MKSARYYLDQAAKMESLAERPQADDMRKGFLQAAQAYRSLAATAARLGRDLPGPDEE